MFDEATSFLDTRQRIAVTRLIRSLVATEITSTNPKYVVVVEHDLAILDCMSDYIHCLYGEPGCYGVVTKRAGLRNGINNFLAGYIPAENMKFRSEALSFKVAQASASELKDMGLGTATDKKLSYLGYPAMTKTLSSEKDLVKKSFTLHVEGGDLADAEVVGLMGENGTGKTTYIEMLAGLHDEKKEAVGQDGKETFDCCPLSLLGMGIS